MIVSVHKNEELMYSALGMLQEGDFAEAVTCLTSCSEASQRAGASHQGAQVWSYLGIAKMQTLDWMGAAECHKAHMQLAAEVPHS